MIRAAKCWFVTSHVVSMHACKLRQRKDYTRIQFHAGSIWIKPNAVSCCYCTSNGASWVWLKIKQEGLRRCWSMFPLTRVPFWYLFFEPQPHDLSAQRRGRGLEQLVLWIAFPWNPLRWLPRAVPKRRTIWAGMFMCLCELFLNIVYIYIY